MKRYWWATLKQVRTLKRLETIEQRGCCDLKLQGDDGVRWYLCRLPEGETDHRVTRETVQWHGGYEPVDIYIDRKEVWISTR